MKHVFLIGLLLVIACSGFAQFNTGITIWTTANFNIGAKSLTYDNSGYGLILNSAFFATHKLQLVSEVSADRFFGDKVLYLDSTGNVIGNPVIYAVKIGPQLFVTQHIALSVACGIARHKIRETYFSSNAIYKFGLTGFFLKNKKLVAQVYWEHIPLKEFSAEYTGFGLGYRLL